MNEGWTAEEAIQWNGYCRFWTGDRPSIDEDYHVEQLSRVIVDIQGTHWEDMAGERWENCEPVRVTPVPKSEIQEEPKSERQQPDNRYILSRMWLFATGGFYRRVTVYDKEDDQFYLGGNWYKRSWFRTATSIEV